MWYARTPPEVAALLDGAINWANENPQLRPESAPAPPLCAHRSLERTGRGKLCGATAADGTTYGDAIAAMLLAH